MVAVMVVMVAVVAVVVVAGRGEAVGGAVVTTKTARVMPFPDCTLNRKHSEA